MGELFGNSGNTQCISNDFSDTLIDFLSNGFMDLHGVPQNLPTVASQEFKAGKVRYIRFLRSPELGSTQEHFIKWSRSPRTFRVILFSIHSDEWNPSSVNLKQACGTNVGVAASFQLSQIHYHVESYSSFTKSFIQLKCNKIVISQKAQVHVKFSNSDNHELPHHQRSSKSNQELSSKEIVNQRNIR
ncbi:hypothetical protein Tco_0847139 [Tanacetum coccineum]